MQSANCVPGRWLRVPLVDLTWDAVVPQVKPAMNEKQTVVLC